MKGVWDFESEGDVTTSTGAVFSTGDSAITLGGGAEISGTNGLVVTFAGDWFDFDTELEGWSVTGGVGAPLALVGLGYQLT